MKTKHASPRKAKFEVERAERDGEIADDEKKQELEQPPEQQSLNKQKEDPRQLGTPNDNQTSLPDEQVPASPLSSSENNSREQVEPSLKQEREGKRVDDGKEYLPESGTQKLADEKKPEISGPRGENKSVEGGERYEASGGSKTQSVVSEFPSRFGVDQKLDPSGAEIMMEMGGGGSQALNPPEEVTGPSGGPGIEEFKVEPKQKRLKIKKKKKKGKPKDFLEEGEEGRAPKKSTEGKEKTSFSNKLVRIALRYTRAPTRFLVKKMPGLRENLLRSNLRISPEGIVSLSLLFSIISIPFTIFGWYELSMMGYGLEGLALPAAALLPFVIGISIPKISASSRSQALDNELPYLFAYITVLAGGGISPIVTLKRITNAGALFPAASKEAKRILMDIEIFGLDAISALERGARLTPNKVFSDFIGGYVAVLKTGGDALSFLEAKLKEIFNYREVKVKSGSEFIATMSEAYIITTVIMGISLMTLYATQNLMTPSITTLDTTPILMFSGLAVPIISLIFIIVIGSSQIREPFSYDLPFYVFLGCIPIGALIYFLPLPLTSYMHLGVSLFAISTPPMFLQMKFKRDKAGVEAKLANFLRDISEIRKTGLAPEKTIEQLADRNYGKLGPHVKRIAAQLSWGTPIKIVLSNFSRGVKSWVARAVAFLLLEVVDVGGGSAKMFISLADFAEKNAQLDKEKKSLVRPYIIIPYIGAILIVATTAMMVYFVSPVNLSFPGVGSPGTQFLPPAYIIAEATTVLLMGSFFQAWVMGFVAGKMGEGSAADGFKHATFLIIISMITVVVSGFFISF